MTILRTLQQQQQHYHDADAHTRRRIYALPATANHSSLSHNNRSLARSLDL